MKFSLVALLAAGAVAAVPNVASRNPPMVPCDTQLQQALDAKVDPAEAARRQKNCLGNAENTFNSCNDAPANTDKDKCWALYESLAGHRREGDPRPTN